MMEYFLDESGNTGDLINKKNDMGFATQPFFTHSCIGVPENKIGKLESFIRELKIKHSIDEDTELKSQEHYIKNPLLVLEIAKFVVDENFTLVCEVMDKKFNIAVSIVNHLIIPAMQNERNGNAQYIRDYLVDNISCFAPDICFITFSELCKKPSEDKLIKCMDSLKEYFASEDNPLEDEGYTVLMIDKTLDEYKRRKEIYGEERTIKWYVPIPDLDSHGNKIKLLPNVHSFYNQIARINKIHNRKLSNVKLTHDISSEFAETLRFCLSEIKTVPYEIMPVIPTCDFKVIETPELTFIKSEDSIGVQVADIIAGFLNRYVHGLLYKEVDMDDIYHNTFNILMTQNRESNPKGTNFVIPISKRNWLFEQFSL
ncbi:TPA: DUF3800 domain-containing protein [Klebsiella pneumoniae]|nr:DUF3800 domain-containing protein [Klebsiella pneumoniae]